MPLEAVIMLPPARSSIPVVPGAGPPATKLAVGRLAVAGPQSVAGSAASISAALLYP